MKYTYYIFAVILICSVTVDAFCWGETDSQGHCSGLGTSWNDIGYERFGALNMIGNAIGNQHLYNPYRASPPSFADRNKMYWDSYNANQWNTDYSRRWGIH